MTPKQLEARKRKVLKSLSKENIMTSYEIRALRLQEQYKNYDPRVRIS